MFQFDSLNSFISMSGHGFYVWISYGLSLAVMIYLVIKPLHGIRQRKRIIRHQQMTRGRATPLEDRLTG